MESDATIALGRGRRGGVNDQAKCRPAAVFADALPNNRKPMGIPQPRWDDLLRGYLAILNEIELVVLVEAMGSEFFRAMKRSEDELKQMRRRGKSDGLS